MTKNNDTIFQKAVLNTNRKNIKCQISIDLPKGVFKKKCLLLSNALDKPFFYPFFMTVSIISIIVLLLCIFISNLFISAVVGISIAALIIMLYGIAAYKNSIDDRIRYYKMKVETFYNNDSFSKRNLLNVDTTNFTKDEICQLVKDSPSLIKAYQKTNGKTELLPKEWQWFNEKKYSLEIARNASNSNNIVYDIIKDEHVIGQITVNSKNNYINHLDILITDRTGTLSYEDNDSFFDTKVKCDILTAILTTFYDEQSKLQVNDNNKGFIELIIDYFNKPKYLASNN